MNVKIQNIIKKQGENLNFIKKKVLFTDSEDLKISLRHPLETSYAKALQSKVQHFETGDNAAGNGKCRQLFYPASRMT